MYSSRPKLQTGSSLSALPNQAWTSPKSHLVWNFSIIPCSRFLLASYGTLGLAGSRTDGVAARRLSLPSLPSWFPNGVRRRSCRRTGTLQVCMQPAKLTSRRGHREDNAHGSSGLSAGGHACACRSACRSTQGHQLLVIESRRRRLLGTSHFMRCSFVCLAFFCHRLVQSSPE